VPWTKKQQRTAQAVEHGWKPKGSAKGFTSKFAEQVVQESKTMPTRPSTDLTDAQRRKMRKHLKVESSK
jgi:hypothetical protein